jgi:hypothetical protein
MGLYLLKYLIYLKNIRYLYSRLGTVDISDTGASITAAISTLATKSNALSGIYPVIGTQTANTGTWTGKINAPALYDGMIIAYYLPYTGSGNATLNLTLSDDSTTGAINCYYQGNTRLTTHFGVGSTILLTYWSAGSIKVSGTATTDNRWTADSSYNTNTTYGAATTAAAGLMPKLTGSTTVYLNGNGAFTTPPDNNTTYATFTSAANGLVPAAKSGTTNYATSGYVLTGAGWKAGTKYNTDTNTTYGAVTSAANGLMTSTDFNKLANIAASANNYTHPSYTSAANGLYKVTVDETGHVSSTTAVAKADITALGIPASDTNTTYAFSNSNPTLAWGTKSTVGTVGGVALTLTMPANPNTNTTYGTNVGCYGSLSGTTLTLNARNFRV